MDGILWLIPALPLAGFVMLVLGGKRLGDPLAGILATLMTTAAFVVGLIVFGGLLGESTSSRLFEQRLFTWIPAGDFSVDIGFLADPLSITWVLFVTFIGALIHLYSIGYMRGDPRFHTFFAYLNLFIFSMLMLVLGNNLLVTFLGWEGVGACSYFLISFWFEKKENATAGKKAFVTNRIGDWGFLVAMFLTFATFGSLRYTEVLPLAPGLAATTATAIAALFFVGAVGKSAQLPLFVWLPDAMAGPTPVSALIHAATMVTAGVYLMVRINPILGASYDELGVVIAWVGVATALIAASVAIAQNDIKKVLAYSTISQLGFMFAAVGVGAYVAAVFHVVTHAFFKALLFLGSGSVIHGVHDEQDMRKMGGLRRFMPVTSVTFLIGVLAIAGIPPLAGFWSKDEILLAEYDKSYFLVAGLIVAAFLTAVYMFRQYTMVFTGKARFDEHEVHPHESGWLMTVPLVVLSGFALVAGTLNLPFLAEENHFLEKWLDPSLTFHHRIDIDTGMKITLALLSALTALAGATVGWVVYSKRAAQADVTEPEVLARAWYLDWAYSKVVDGPGRTLFDAAAWFDRNVIDGAVNGVGWVARGTGSNLRTLQNGLVRSYAMVVAIGGFLMVGYVLLRMAY